MWMERKKRRREGERKDNRLAAVKYILFVIFQDKSNSDCLLNTITTGTGDRFISRKRNLSKRSVFTHILNVDLCCPLWIFTLFSDAKCC